MKKPKLVIVKYCIGVDLFGQPLYVLHNVYLNTYTKNNKTHERKNSNQ